jgi:hypothetical protein
LLIAAYLFTIPTGLAVAFIFMFSLFCLTVTSRHQSTNACEVYTVIGSHLKLTPFMRREDQLIDVDVREVKVQEDSDLEPSRNFSTCA